ARDFNVDTKGALLLVEETRTIDAIPAGAKATILRKVGDGKLTRVETLTKTGRSTVYEAAYTDKKGKKHEALVTDEGADAKPSGYSPSALAAAASTCGTRNGFVR